MRTKTNDWGNPETGEILYGIDIWAKTRRAPTGEWCHAAEDGKPLLFKTPEERDAKRQELRRRPPSPAATAAPGAPSAT